METWIGFGGTKYKFYYTIDVLIVLMEDKDGIRGTMFDRILFSD